MLDLSDEPVAVPQKLNTNKQEPDEALECLLQKVLNIATDGYRDFKTMVIQQKATETF